MDSTDDTPLELADAQLDNVDAAGLLLPAVQTAGDSLATPPKKKKYWPWHYW